MSNSLRPHGLQPTRLLCSWDFPGKSTGVGCHFLLQGIFPTQGSNPGLQHCRQTPYCLNHQGAHSIQQVPFLKICFIYSSCCLVAKSCPTLSRSHQLQPAMILCPWDFPDKNTGMTFHFLLQGIFLTQGSHLQHWQVDSLPVSHQGSLVIYSTL